MKKSIAFVLVSLLSASSFAYIGPDQEFTTFMCKLVDASPDHDINVKVIKGGLAGATRVEVAETTIAGTNTTKYFVRESSAEHGTRLDNIVFQSKAVTLTISNTEEDAKGNRPSTLDLFVNTNAPIANMREENMLCQMLAIPM